MSRHNKQGGFTIVEIMIALVVGALVMIGVFTFFGSSMKQYFRLEDESLAFADLAANGQRIASVVRGATGIVTANSNSLTIYGYFSPYDQYVSLITYYPDATSTQLLADVTQMTSNPPIGTPISGSLKTFTIINNFYVPSGTNTFEYLDSSGATMTMPIADLNTIKGIRINLADKPSNPTSPITQMSVSVSLRNRKTNL